MLSRTRARSRGVIVGIAIGALILTAAVCSGWSFAAMTADTAECGRANPLVQEAASYLGQPAPTSEANWRETESNLERLGDRLRRISVLDRGEMLADAVDNLAAVASLAVSTAGAPRQSGYSSR